MSGAEMRFCATERQIPKDSGVYVHDISISWGCCPKYHKLSD